MEATLNVTLNGQNGTLVDPIPYDMTDDEIRGVVAEAVATGGIPGITPIQGMDMTDFIVDRFPPSDEVPVARCFFRPKTPFGRG